MPLDLRDEGIVLVLGLFQRQALDRTHHVVQVRFDADNLMSGSDEAGGSGPRLRRDLFAREHAGDLLEAAADVERLGAGFNGDSFTIAAGGLVKPEVRVPVCRDLRRMRYSQDLSPMPQPRKALPNCRSRRPADTRVDFVEDENRGGRLLGEHNFEREKKAGQFAARSDLHQWAWI